MNRTLLLLMFATSGAAFAEPQPLAEEECQAVVEPANGPAEVRDLPGVAVLDEKATGALELPTFADAKVKTVVCWRSAARFVESDRRVADAGFRFAVKAHGAAKDGGDRALVLEKINGGFRIRALQGGEFTAEEREWVVDLLQSLNNAKGVPTFVGTEEKT